MIIIILTKTTFYPEKQQKLVSKISALRGRGPLGKIFFKETLVEILFPHLNDILVLPLIYDKNHEYFQNLR